MGWVFFALLSAVFAALVAILGKMGVRGIDSTTATTVRAVIMALFLVGVFLFLGKFSELAKFDKRALLFVALSGIAGALSWLAYFFALKYGSAHSVAALDRTSVAMVAVLAALFLGEVFTWKVALGALLMVTGAVLML